jgi:predicted transcriptional regulator
MSLRTSPEREQELEELLAFLEFHQEHLRRKPSGPPPAFTLRATVERIAGEHGRSKALEGTRQAVNDVLEELSDLTRESVKVVDEALVAAGLVTLSSLRRRYSASYKRLLKRGSIKTETEYYLVNGLVVDQTSGLSPEERESFQRMLEKYEG